MVAKYTIAWLSIVLCASCAVNERSDNALGRYQKVKLEIPAIDSEGFANYGPLSTDQIQDIIDKYSHQDDAANSIISERTDEIQESNYLSCGGVYWESDRLYKKGLKFKIVGVTEKWIPIEGKVTKVLQLKLAE